MTGTGIIHSNNLQICLGVFRSRRAAGANTLRSGTHRHRSAPLRARPAPPGMGPRSRAGCAPRPAPGRSPHSPPPLHPRSLPLFAFQISCFGTGREGGEGKGRGTQKGLRGWKGSPRGVGDRGDTTHGTRDVWGELLSEMLGRGGGGCRSKAGRLSAGAVFGGTRGADVAVYP